MNCTFDGGSSRSAASALARTVTRYWLPVLLCQEYSFRRCTSNCPRIVCTSLPAPTVNSTGSSPRKIANAHSVAPGGTTGGAQFQMDVDLLGKPTETLLRRPS